MKKLITCLVLSCCLYLFCLSANAKTIVIVSDDWCPINCVPNTEKPGYLVELARTIFKEAGHNLVYKKVPWERAIKSTRKGQYNGIIGAFVGDAPDFVFPKNEQGAIGNSFFIKKDNTWKYTGIASLSNVKIGVIQGYDYGEEMNKYIKDNDKSKKVQLVSGDTALEKNIRKLIKGRIDAILETESVFLYKINEMGVSDKIISAGKAVEPEKAYIAFSPAIPESKEYAKILSDGIEKLRKSGELKRILQRYGLKDWK